MGAGLILMAVSAGAQTTQSGTKDLSGTSSNQGALTLDEALQEAEQNSPDYRRAQAVERETSWGQFEAVADGFLPHLSAKGEHFFNVQYGSEQVDFGAVSGPFPENYPKTTLSLDASFDLFDGLKNIHKLDSANNHHEAAKILSGWSGFQIHELVRQKFYMALAAKMLSDLSDENVKTLEDHLRIVNDQLENGQATKYDVLRVEVELSQAKSDQISDHDNVELSREDLVQTIGLKSDDRALSGQLPILDADALLKAIQTVDFSQRPDLKAKELQAKAAADESAAAGSYLVPKVSLIGEYQWYNSQAFSFSPYALTDTGNYENSYYFGAAATWDLLDGGESIAKGNEASERANESKAELDAAQIQAPYQFDLWKRRLASSVSLYQAKLVDVDKSKESVRLATLGYKAGTRTTTDVLDAELDQFRASAGVVQAQIDALQALINLELAIGKRISHE